MHTPPEARHIEFPGAGVANGCAPSVVGAVIQTLGKWLWHVSGFYYILDLTSFKVAQVSNRTQWDEIQTSLEV